jgi:hypothetical protein
MTAITILKQWFANFKKPTQEHFWAWIDSFWHKSEKIPMANIEGLESLVEGTASAEQLRNHLTDTHAHKEVFDKKVDKVPGKKLSTEDFTTELRTKLEGLQQVDTSGLLPKGAYTGNASSLKADIDKKVDKVAGKGLSSNDYTNEEKRKNEENALKRVANITVTGDVNKIITITFADSTVMQAPFKDNDHIPLADVHMNSLNFNVNTGVLTGVKSDGNEITVSLEGRYSLIGHHHDERYAPITHHHNEYALRTHRHNWDDIDGKPRFDFLPLGGGVITPVDSGDHQEGIRIGRADNGWAMITLGTQGLSGVKEGEYALARDANGNFLLRTAIGGVMKDLIIANKNEVIFSDIIKVPTLVLTSGSSPKDIVKIRVADKTLIIGNEEFNEVYYYRGAGFRKDGSSDNKVLLGGGGDIEISELLARKGGVVSNSFPLRPDHRNMVLFVTNSVTLELGGLESLGSISFRKVFDVGEVTFNCVDKSIIYTGDTQFNGKRGSTAVVSVYDKECYIDIRNV